MSDWSLASMSAEQQQPLLSGPQLYPSNDGEQQRLESSDDVSLSPSTDAVSRSHDLPSVRHYRVTSASSDETRPARGQRKDVPMQVCHESLLRSSENLEMSSEGTPPAAETCDDTRRSRRQHEDALLEVGYESLPRSSDNPERSVEATMILGSSSDDIQRTQHLREAVPIQVGGETSPDESERLEIVRPPISELPTYDEVCPDRSNSTSNLTGPPPPYELLIAKNHIRRPPQKARHARDRLDLVDRVVVTDRRPRRSRTVVTTAADSRQTVRQPPGCCERCLLCCVKGACDCFGTVVLGCCSALCSVVSMGRSSLRL